jgi:hypothetical protein
MTSTMPTNPHPKPPTPSPAFTGPAFAEKIVEGVEEFVTDVVVVVWNPHVNGTVEDHVDEINKKDRQRHVAKHRHCTFGSASSPQTRNRRPLSELPLDSADRERRADNV